MLGVDQSKTLVVGNVFVFKHVVGHHGEHAFFVCDVLLPEKVVFFSRANLKSSRAFFLVSVCAMTLTLFSPSLTLTYTDVLLEQRDLFARIDQVRVLLSKTERGERKREANVSLTRRFVILFPIGGGLDCLSRDDD